METLGFPWLRGLRGEAAEEVAIGSRVARLMSRAALSGDVVAVRG